MLAVVLDALGRQLIRSSLHFRNPQPGNFGRAAAADINRRTIAL